VSEKFHSRRHRITIQRKIYRRNSCGEVLYDWQAVCQTWAQICGEVVTIRYQADLLPGYRVVIGDDHFEITAVIDRKFRRGRLVELHLSNITERGRVSSRVLAMNSNA
jgi:head-tail adaptor